MFDSWSPDRRLREARQRTDRLVDECTNLIWTQANISKFVFRSALTEQVTHSRAAIAFRALQHDLVSHAIVRLCAIWDRPSQDKVSIPTILALMESSAVRGLWIGELIHYWKTQRIHMVDEEAWPGAHAEVEAHLRERSVRDFVPRAANAFLTAENRTRRLMASDRLGAAKQRRNRHLAHNLTLKDDSAVRMVRYEDLTGLLIPAVCVVGRLHSAINGSSMDFRGCFRQSRKAVAELWDNTIVKLPPRRVT